MHRIVLLIALSWIGMAVAAESTPEAPILLPPSATTSPERVATLAERDRALSAAVLGCDIGALRPMVVGDSKFLQGKHGKAADTGPKSIANAAVDCERRHAGTDVRSHRERVPAPWMPMR